MSTPPTIDLKKAMTLLETPENRWFLGAAYINEKTRQVLLNERVAHLPEVRRLKELQDQVVERRERRERDLRAQRCWHYSSCAFDAIGVAANIFVKTQVKLPPSFSWVPIAAIGAHGLFGQYSNKTKTQELYRHCDDKRGQLINQMSVVLKQLEPLLEGASKKRKES